VIRRATHRTLPSERNQGLPLPRGFPNWAAMIPVAAVSKLTRLRPSQRPHRGAGGRRAPDRGSNAMPGLRVRVAYLHHAPPNRLETARALTAILAETESPMAARHAGRCVTNDARPIPLSCADGVLRAAWGPADFDRRPVRFSLQLAIPGRTRHRAVWLASGQQAEPMQVTDMGGHGGSVPEAAAR